MRINKGIVAVVFGWIALGLVLSPVPAFAQQKPADEVTVVGDPDKPQSSKAPPTSFEPMKTTKTDPGIPDRPLEEGAVAPASTKSDHARDFTPPGSAGRAKKSGFPWWILLIVGAAAAVGAS